MSNQQAQSAAPVENDATSLVAVADSLFSKGVRQFPLSDGFMVEIRTANLGSLGTIVRVFSRLMEKFNEGQMRALVDLVADAQMLAITQGQDPKNVPLNMEALIGKAFGSGRLVENIFLSILDEMPAIVETFTNIPPERVPTLEIDEGILIMGGIFTLNYGFFTQRVRPIITSMVAQAARASLAEKQSKKPAPEQKLAPKVTTTAGQSKKSETA